MANAKTTKAAPAGKKVKVRLFKDGEKYKDDVFVAVNGKSCLIKRGQTVEIEEKFAEVLENSANQDAATADLITAESDNFRKKQDQLE